VEDLMITTFAERPELIDKVYTMADIWPAFMGHDMVANALFRQVVPKFPHLCIAATDPDGVLVARARAIPFRWNRPSRRRELPDGGWDRIMVWGMEDHLDGETPDTVSALEVAIDPARIGSGLSSRMLAAMREAAHDAGFSELVAPVRCTQKHLSPRLPMADYADVKRPDGLPIDPWLRVHVRAGGVIEKVAPASMVIAGSLDDWREWTALPFDQTGPVDVPQALVPVWCDAEHDYAVYVEPNVWVRHQL
jgi:GNAT superfamily N-acetyltransferase